MRSVNVVNRISNNYNFFLDGIGGGFGHPGHPLTPSLPPPSPHTHSLITLRDSVRRALPWLRIIWWRGLSMALAAATIWWLLKSSNFQASQCRHRQFSDVSSAVDHFTRISPTHRPPQPAHTKDTCRLTATLSSTLCWRTNPPADPLIRRCRCLHLSGGFGGFAVPPPSPVVCRACLRSAVLADIRLHHCRLDLRTRTIT